jgi:hypothetical protein
MLIRDILNNRKIMTILLIILIGIPATLTTSILFFISQESRSEPTIVGGTITEDTTWQGHVLVHDNVFISQGVVLTVLPGAFVEFKHFRGYKNISRVGLFTSGGTIRAIGTPEQQIWFTSDAEDPVNGDWSGITCGNSNKSIFEYVIVEFSIVGIEFSNSNISISHSIIRWIHTEGIYATQSYGLINNNLIYENGYHEISLEDFNHDILVQFNIFNGGHFGVITEATNSTLIGNYFVNYTGTAITATALSNITILENKFENILLGQIYLGPTVNATISGNDLIGNGSVPIPIIDFPDPKTRALDYVPGDPEDQYLYVYDTIDETREIINRLDNETSFDWSLEYVNGSLWKFKHRSSDIGNLQNFARINTTSEVIEEFENNDIINPNGLAYDGKFFWTQDIVLKNIYKFIINSSDKLEIIESFPIPGEIGAAFGIATDGTHLYLSGSDGTNLFKLDFTGTIVETIALSGDSITGVLTWTGTHFWAASEIDLTKWTITGTLAGKIYPAAEGTIGITWDGSYLWTSHKTCEVWTDGKIFQSEIVDDQIAL